MPDRESLDANALYRLVDVGRGLMETLALDDLLDRVLSVAREVTGARYAAVGILGPGRRELERFITSGIDAAGRQAIGDLPRGRGILGLLIENPKPLRLGDLGAHPRSYGFPQGHPPMRSFLGVPILIRGQAWGNLYLTEKQGADTFGAADEESLVILAGWAALGIEHARLHEQAQRRQGELEHTVRALESSTTIARAVGGETDLQGVLELISKRGRALVDARWLAIMLCDGDSLVVTATAGEPADVVPGLRLPIEGSMSGAALRSGRTRRVDDAGASLTAFQPGDVDIAAQCALVIPLIFRGRGLGVILAVDRGRDGPRFTSEDEELMGGFAASAATAVATAKSIEQDLLRRAIQAAERERGYWARELHDETLQQLGALKMLLASTRRQATDEVAAALDQAIGHVQDQIEELRSIITELRPAALDELGVEPALEALVGRTSALSDLEIDFSANLSEEGASEAGRRDAEVESAVYRLVQEALTNVTKHANATAVEVRVIERDHVIDVVVTDDGHGFDPQAGGAGFGLTGMRERVSMVDGTFEIDSQPGGGTTVRATIPIGP